MNKAGGGNPLRPRLLGLQFHMKSESLAKAAVAIALLSILLAGVALFKGSASPEMPSAPSHAMDVAANQAVLTTLGGEIAELRTLLTQSADRSDEEGLDTEMRLNQLESSVDQIQSALDGISLEKASEDRQALFKAVEGYLKADEYFEAEKFAIAGEGYLAFLSTHPDHPDAHNIMGRARRAFARAGYPDKAMWVQEEMIANFPENRFNDLFVLGQMKKSANRYDDAIAHVEEAMELAPTPEDRAWKQLYWAWYHQLRDGNEAGLAMYQQVAEDVAAAGITNPRVIERVQEKITELEAVER